MTAIAFTVEYYTGGQADPGLRRLAMAFERAGAEVADVGKHILPAVVPVLEAATKRQFAAEGQGPDAGNWKPLSARYAEWKEANFPGMPILQRTQALVRGLTDGGASTARRDISGDSLVFGTRGVPYASFHQTGTAKMPARPPIDLDDKAAAELRSAALKGVRAAVRAASDGLVDFTGSEYEGQAVQSGARGGRFIMQGGSRVYLKQRASGDVVRFKYGGGR